MAMDTPTLEALPAELKIQVLKSIPDYKSLISLTSASRVYYQLYVGCREEIDSCLVEKLGESLPLDDDMAFTYIFSRTLAAEFTEPRNNNIFYLWYLNHMISMGPAFLHKLHQEDREKRHHMVYQNARAYRDGFVLFVDEFASPCPLTSPADVYERGIFPPLLSGLGPMEQPNAAWGWFYYHFYGALNQEVIISLRRGLGSSQIREWGYALWDTQRLLEWDAFNHLMDEEDEVLDFLLWR